MKRFLFDEIKDEVNKIEEEWMGMPECVNVNKNALKSIKINFETDEDYRKFAELIGQKLTSKTKSIWFPYRIVGQDSLFRYVDEP